MGTTWHVTVFDPQKRNFQHSLDSLLILVNRAISTYDSTAEISEFNRSEKGIKSRLPFFIPPLKISEKVFQQSGGAFDPTVMPLVNLWGFGPAKVERPDSSAVRKVLEVVGLEKVSHSGDSIFKSVPGTQLDFSAIGQGYGADVLTEFLKSKGIKNMLVEVGGEGMAIGMNEQSGKPWKLGLVNPAAPESFFGFIELSDRSFSTSGNYFNYREIDGVRYAHTIDPKSGFPTAHSIMSASVFAENCALADAWATAFMSMGHEKAIALLKEHPELDACLIWSVKGGMEKHLTPGAEKFITFQKP